MLTFPAKIIMPSQTWFLKQSIILFELHGRFQDSLSVTVALVALEVLSQQSVQEIAVLKQMMGSHFLMVTVVQLV